LYIFVQIIKNMINKFISLGLIAFVSLFYVNHSSAQTEKKIKVVVIEKTIDENGKIKETKVIKEGEEAKAYMEKMNISDGDVIEWIENEEDDSKPNIKSQKRKLKIITKDDDGNEDVIEWEGDGEMPADLRKTLEENDVEILNKEKEISVTVKDNMSTARSRVMIINEKNTNEEVIEFDIENGEMGDDVEKLLRENGMEIEIIDNGDAKKFMIVAEDDDQEQNNNKAQLGVFLDSTEKGVRIIDTIEGSAAVGAGLRKGDVITAIGDQLVATMHDVVTEIGNYKPSEIIIVHFLRDNIARSTEVTLKERDMTQKYTRTVTVESTEEKDGKHTKKLEKRVIIKEKK